jgi:hypothetical protein
MAATIKDVAGLAGVSTTTVSRVMNGAGNVSGETKTKVLTAISSLQYCPNGNAAELRRANRRGSPKSRVHLRDLVGKRTRSPSYSGSDSQEAFRQRGQIQSLEGEYAQVRRVVAKLSKDLEKLRSIMGIVNRH